MSSARILVIDDSMVVRRQVQMALVGYEVLSSPSASAGLELARENQPQLILLDVSMPGVSLLEVLKELSRDPDLKRIPVVLLVESGTGQPAESIGIHSRVVGVLTKPLSREQIEETVVIAESFVGDDDPTAPTTEQIANVRSVLADILRPRLAKLPSWEVERGELDPVEFYFEKLFTPLVLRGIAMRAQVGQAGPAAQAGQASSTNKKAEPSQKVGIWDQDRSGVAVPLTSWLSRRFGLIGVDVTKSTDPFADLTREPLNAIVVNAETVGLDSLPSMLKRLSEESKEAKLVVTSNIPDRPEESNWRASGATVLIKPFSLAELERVITITRDV